MLNPNSSSIYQKKEINLPRYQDYCIANIPNTVLSLFGKPTQPPLPQGTIPPGKYNHVIFLLVDALGYHTFLKNRSLFNFLEPHSNITPLTSLFPSTTSAALTTLHTGLLPIEHGMLEWHLYIPQLEAIIKSLPFCLEDKAPDSLENQPIPPKEILFNQKTIYQTLEEENVKTFSLSLNNYWQSVYSKLSRRGSKRIPFFDLSELFTRLEEVLNNVRQKHEKTFTYAYIDYLDSVSHQHGPNSKFARAELIQIMTMFKKLFWDKINLKDFHDTLILIAADHGQIPVNNQKTIRLNQLPKLTKMLVQPSPDKPILSAGGPRDAFLHVQPDQQHHALAYLKEELSDRAKIYATQEVLKKGWFGKTKPTNKVLERLGNVLILPKDNNLVWYERKDHDHHPKKGHHGGLSRQEMYVPFIAATPGKTRS